MTPIPIAHEISFTGSLVFGLPECQERFPTLALVEAGLVERSRAAGALAHARELLPLEGRPDSSVVSALAETVLSTRAERLLAIGCGAVLDAAKFAARRVELGSSRPLELVFIPCGAEPYRAVARFAVVDDGSGNRPTVVDPTFGRATVVVLPELLHSLPEHVVALHALDTTVHAVESLLSTGTHPFARALAVAALRIVAENALAADGHEAETRSRLIVAAFLAAEAFSSTKLGLAHAIASPLGAAVGTTHDAINGVLGEAVVRFWADESSGFAEVATGLGVEPTVEDVCGALERLRLAAGLPPSLRELGIGWKRVEAVLPQSARSSGIAVLPRPLSDGALAAFARRAWSGRLDKEVLDAERA